MAGMKAGIESLRNAAIGLSAATGFGAMIKGAIDAGDELNKLAQKTGISVESLSEMKLGAQLADVDMQALATGMKGFNKAMVESQDATSKSAQIFKALGVDISQGPNIALQQVAQRFSEMKDGAEKSTLAVELFGKAGMGMIPWLNQGADGMARAAEQARNLGLVMSKETAAQAEQLNDQLKILAMRSEALGLKIAGTIVPALVSLTGNLVTAAEKGSYLWQTIVEGAKMSGAVLSALTPRWAMQSGLIDKMNQALFDYDEHLRSMKEGPNVWPGAAQPSKPAGSANNEALACALSGGKWDGKQCVRGPVPAAAKSPYLDAGQIAKKQIDGEEELVRLAREQTEYLEKQQKLHMDAAEAIRRQLDPMIAINDKTREMATLVNEGLLAPKDAEAAFEKLMLETVLAEQAANSYSAKLKDVNDIGRELGLTFTSAFEDAIAGGKKFSDILKGLGNDIAKIIVRKSITKPLAEGISDSIGGSGLGDFLKGLFKADGGPVSAGEPYIVGERGPELMVPGSSGTIVPNAALAGAGGSIFNVDLRGASVEAVARLERFVSQINGTLERRAVFAVADAQRRGAL